MHTKPSENVTKKLQPHVSNHQLLYPHSLNHLTLQTHTHQSPLCKIFSSAPGLTFGVTMKTDAPLIHCLEELESLATGGQVHQLMQRPHILLFIEPELAHSSFHSCFSTKRLLQTSLPDQAVRTFNGVLSRTLRVPLQEHVAKCDSMSSRIVVTLLKKVIFLKNYWVFLQAIFYHITSDPRQHF